MGWKYEVAVYMWENHEIGQDPWAVAYEGNSRVRAELWLRRLRRVNPGRAYRLVVRG